MFWHYFKEVVGILLVVHGLLTFIEMARRGQLPRLWNVPMRVTVFFGLLFGLLWGVGAWAGRQNGSVNSFSTGLEIAAVSCFFAGLISFAVFSAGFLITMIRNFKLKHRPVPIRNGIDNVQTLLLSGERREAILLYQMQNNVTPEEAEEAVDAIGAALQAGLRV